MTFPTIWRIIQTRGDLDLDSLEKHEKYEIKIQSISTYKNTDLNLNDYQKSILKFIFKDNLLQKYAESTISGEYLLITVSGFDNGNGSTVAYIFCE